MSGEGGGIDPSRDYSNRQIFERTKDIPGEGNRVAAEVLMRKGRPVGIMPGCDCCYSIAELAKVRGVGSLCGACLAGQCPKATCRVCPKCRDWFVNANARVDHIRVKHARLYAKIAKKLEVPLDARDYARTTLQDPWPDR